MSFPFSVWYGIGSSVTPLYEDKTIERDISDIASLGFKYIRFWANWRDLEPKKDQFNFELLDKLFSYTLKYDLKVILQVYLEYAPDWLYSIYPDASYVSEQGIKIIPAGSPGVCLDHPEVRKEAERFLEKLARHIIKYPNFFGWDVWSEPLIIQWVYQPSGWRGIYCYCSNSIKRFQKWLEQRYKKDINLLNRAWHRQYENFNGVEPPRFVVLHYGKENIDWITFNIEKLREDLEWRVKTIRKVDTTHIITSHTHGGTSALSNPLYGNPDDWEMVKVVDAWGTSFYPKHAGRREEDPLLDAFILDVTRSASKSVNKQFWIGELQGGQGVGGLRIVSKVKPEDINIWIWQAIAHGAKGINIYHWYPMMIGYESSGYGLVDPSGNITDRAEIAGKNAKIVSEYEDLFTKVEPLMSDVGILYNIDAYKVLWLLQPYETLHAESPRGITFVSYSLLGLYRILAFQNIQADFISLEQLERGDSNKYKVLFMPGSIALRERSALAIKEYVRNGGVIVVDSRFGWISESGYIDSEIPVYGLSDVIGGNEEYIQTVKKTTIYVTSERIPGLSRGDAIHGTLYQSGLRLKGNSETIGQTFTENDTLNSLVINNYYKGMSIYFGTSLGYSYELKRYPSIKKAINGILNLVKIDRPIQIQETFPSNVYIEIRALTKGNENLLFVINHSDKLVKSTIKIDLPVYSKDHIIDLYSNEKIETKEGNKLQLSLKPKQVIIGYF